MSIPEGLQNIFPNYNRILPECLHWHFFLGGGGGGGGIDVLE